MIYIGKREYSYKGKLFSHMVADNIEELHEMADKLNLKREWFQDGKRPHYDISKSKKKQALQYGAKEVSDRFIVNLFKDKMLKYKLERFVDMRDWDNLVESTYNKPYCLQQQDGCMSRGIIKLDIDSRYVDEDEADLENYESIPEVINGDKMKVQFSTWLKRDGKKPLNPTQKELEDCSSYQNSYDRNEWCEKESRIRMFFERNFYPDLQMVANDLYKRGLIEEGKYIINIDW